MWSNHRVTFTYCSFSWMAKSTWVREDEMRWIIIVQYMNSSYGKSALSFNIFRNELPQRWLVWFYLSILKQQCKHVLLFNSIFSPVSKHWWYKEKYKIILWWNATFKVKTVESLEIFFLFKSGWILTAALLRGILRLSQMTNLNQIFLVCLVSSYFQVFQLKVTNMGVSWMM